MEPNLLVIGVEAIQIVDVGTLRSKKCVYGSQAILLVSHSCTSWKMLVLKAEPSAMCTVYNSGCK